MKVSDPLKQEAERYSKTRSFALNSNLKKELAEWHKAAGHGKLNIACSTCVRNGMSKLLKSINDGEQLMPRIHFIGIKE